MSQIGRNIKNLDPTRQLKTESRIHSKNYLQIEELIQLIEKVALTLASGISNTELIVLLVANLRSLGPQLESISKDILDRAFVTFRNASQDERINIMIRLRLLELIELRARSWQDDGINTYYKHKANNVEPEGFTNSTNFIEKNQSMNTPPLSMGLLTLSQSITSSTILSQGELVKASGKFSKPTKIPGKNYSKDEVVIRNADSGKVMGIKGRRVHMIEELSETVISFQRVNPGAKERLVQITGPNEEKINYAKQLIEDTIRRNASPIPYESTMMTTTRISNGNGESCSSASSTSDETSSRLFNRTNICALAGAYVGTPNSTNYVSGSKSTSKVNNSNQILLHSFSTNDASLGEYKYTVNVGNHLLKITGDNCELVRVAKLVLDDYFSSNEFLASVEAGGTFDESSDLKPTTPTTPTALYLPSSNQFETSNLLSDKGNESEHITENKDHYTNTVEDDDVFIVESTSPVQPNDIIRSRRSHFSRKDSDSDKTNNDESQKSKSNERIVYENETLVYYSKSPHSWTLPYGWEQIIKKHSAIVRNKDLNDQQYRFDGEKYLSLIKSGKPTLNYENINFESESPEPE